MSVRVIGLKRGCVELVPYKEEWQAMAKDAIARLYSVLGDIILSCEHVGSTSVEGLVAKPIIDIALLVRDYNDIISRAEALARAGFHYRPSASGEGGLLLASGPFYEGTGEEQTHFVHVALQGSPLWDEYISFRDYLRAFPDMRDSYGEVKTEILQRGISDRASYLDGKSGFIAMTKRRAIAMTLLGREVKAIVDRPVGAPHPKYSDLLYPVNYGYIEGMMGGDGEPLDAYILGVYEPLKCYTGVAVALIHRKDDVEDKLVVAPMGVEITREQILRETEFMEKYYDSVVYIKEKLNGKNN